MGRETVTNDAPPRRGELIGQRCGASYVITSLLGEGGMGQVYLATSELLAGTQAAVKVLHLDLMKRKDALARFRAEIFAAGKIRDPNVVKVFDAGTLADGRLYMLMAYCAGGSLEALLAKKRALPFELVLTIIAPIASALDAAHHDAKITHRDIKPGNILIAYEPGGPARGQLGDFGICKLHDDKLSDDLKTGTRSIMGSPGYIAPEQCTGRGAAGVDHRADIYALSSVIYEMVTGQRPYPGDSLYELISSVSVNAPFPRPRALRPDLPPAWDNIILDGLAHRREDRIQTAKELVRRLAHALPNGDALLSYVAPRLIDSARAPTAATIADGIGPAATQWSAAHSAHSIGGSSRGRAIARMVAMIAVGALVGGAAVAAVGHVRGTAAVAPIVDARVVAIAPIDAREPEVIVAAALPPPIDAALISIDAAPISIDAAPPIDAPWPAPVPLPVPAPRVDKPLHPVAAAPAQTGSLRVQVDPWAQVAISGQKQTFVTPFTTTLPVGHYRVTLTKGAQTETVDIVITPGKTTNLQRTW